jgi:hypothetical protein
VRQFLLGLLCGLGLVAAAAAYVWHYAPESLPAEWRRDNPNSVEYAPVVYRWRDDAGVVQLTDKPPSGRRYEEVRIDSQQNVVPTTLPTGSGH